MSQAFTRRRFLQQSGKAMVLTGAGSALLAACGTGNSPATTTSIPVITYRYPDFAGLKGVQEVEDALNKILVEKAQAKIKLMPIAGGTYEQKMKLLFSARQTADIVFTAPWTNNYYQLVQNGDLQPLDDILQKDAPDLYKSMPSSTWEAARFQGKIYAVINQQIFVKPWGVSIRKDLADKYKVDLTSINQWSDLEPLMTEIKKDGIIPIQGDHQSTPWYRQEYYGWDSLNDNGYVAIKATDPARKVFNIFEQPELKELVQLAKKWRDAGYFDAAEQTTDNAPQLFKAGKYGMVVGEVVKPGGALELQAQIGYAVVEKALTKPILTTSGVAATLNAIAHTCPNPDAALRILNVINSDATAYNILAKGIEGRDYVFTDKAKGVIGAPSGKQPVYNPSSDWEFGDQFNAYYSDASQVGSWEATKKLNDDATPSQALGFALDTTNVQTQVAQCKAVGDEYKSLFNGKTSNFEADYAKFLSAMKTAGIDQIVSEAQNQLDSWAKTNKKS